MSGILRYAPRHFTDLLLTRGAAILTIGFLFTFPVYVGGEFGPLDRTTEHEEMVRLFGEMLRELGLFFTLLATYGIAGADARQGFYRFLFARPLSPVRYYAVSYVLTTIVYVLGLLGTVAIWSLLIRPTWPLPYLGTVLVDYLLLSTLIMVFSPLTNGDWVVALVALALSAGLRLTYPRDASLVGRVLDVVLPPTDPAPAFPPGGGVHWEPLLVRLVYAALLFVLALVIVRKLPMGASA